MLSLTSSSPYVPRVAAAQAAQVATGKPVLGASPEWHPLSVRGFIGISGRRVVMVVIVGVVVGVVIAVV